uniref:NAD(+) hydrolase SARM1 n=1 Tax=Sinocyclocheilus grahami TaxID=75366 RepID=A0A672QUK5_SINGR
MFLSLVVYLSKFCRYFSMFSTDRLTVPEYVSYRLHNRRTSSGPKAVSPGISTDVQAVLDGSLPALRSAIKTLKSSKDTGDVEETRRAIAETFQLVEEAWVLPTVGRQVAEEICNRIRLDGGLELLLLLLQTPAVEITYESAKLLEQILVSENRIIHKCEKRLRIDQIVIFQEIGAVQSLKRIVMYSSNATVCSLAKRALTMMSEDVPRRILSSVPNWKSGEVQTWLQQIGFSAFSERFQELQVDGDLLLNIKEQDLIQDLSMTSGLTRKRFLRDLRVLKTYANYSTCDPNNLADWLADIDPRFRQYTYGLVQSGVDRNNIIHITEQQLLSDCHVENGIHRAKILSSARRPAKPCLTDSQPAGPDVFISYRRTTGSQLASLLKVHLQLRGFSVFIDVEKLEAGRFEEKLITSVQRARNFILVLSANALDKCMGDVAMKDWVHKEIVTALNGKKNIVPVTDNFVWPDPASLPEDMSSILKFNGIKWSHEYQEATIEKILRFLKGCPSKEQPDGAKTDKKEPQKK